MNGRHPSGKLTILPATLIPGCLLGLVCIGTVVAGYYGYDDAKALFRDGYIHEALSLFERLAADGDGRAQHRMGQFYQGGEHVPRDLHQACDWFERAADRGHSRAMFELANCYLDGEGRSRDINTALYLYGMVAEEGMADAQYRLAQIYAAGSGVPRNPERAYIYLFLALRGDLGRESDLAARLEAELNERQLERARRFALRQLERQGERMHRKSKRMD